MVDQLAVVIAYLLGNATVTGLFATRVAAKHQYATRWAKNSLGLVVTLSGGPGEIDIPIYRGRVAVYSYAYNTSAAMNGLNVVRGQLQNVRRYAVTQLSNRVLFYFCVPDGDPSLLWDDKINMDVALQFFDAMIGQEVI